MSNRYAEHVGLIERCTSTVIKKIEKINKIKNQGYVTLQLKKNKNKIPSQEKSLIKKPTC